MNYLTWTVRIILVVLWAPGFVYAAGVAMFPNSPLEIPAVVAFATFFFSTLIGVTTLALRILGQLQSGKPLINPYIFILAHMGGSWSAGAFGFTSAMGLGADVWKLIGTVMIFSYLGVKVFEKASEKIWGKM